MPGRRNFRPANLTQELAQLLAASIARQQASSKGSARTDQRRADEPRQPRLGRLQSTHACAGVQGRALRAVLFAAAPQACARWRSRSARASPTTSRCRYPPPGASPPTATRRTWYRHQMGAALLGLAAGLMIVVPTVLWLSGWFEPHKSKPDATAPRGCCRDTSDLKAAEVRTMKVQVRPLEKPTEAAAQYVTGSIEPRAALESGQAPEQPSASALAAKIRGRAAGRGASARGRPARPGLAARRERRRDGSARDAGRGGGRQPGARLVRAGRDLRSQHAGGLGLARRRRPTSPRPGPSTARRSTWASSTPRTASRR